MQFLGIDYGKSKIGLALGESDSKLAQPFKVLRSMDQSEAVSKIVLLINDLRIDKIVIGISSGAMKDATLVFAELLKRKTTAQIEFVDESFSTQMAQAQAIEAGANRKKRRELEDAHSATLILQNYLDGLV